MRIVAKWKRNGSDTVLRITENKEGLRGTVLEGGRRTMSAVFREKDGDADEYRVMEYFGFNRDNSHEITDKE